MQIRNPFIGTDPVRCLVINTSGVQSTLSLMSKPLLEVEDDVVEMIAEWPYRGQVQSKAWMKERGWLELEEYRERKRFAEEQARFAEEQAKAHKRRAKQEKTNEDHSPPANPVSNDPS